MVKIEAIAQGATVWKFLLLLAPTLNQLPRAIRQPLVSSPEGVSSEIFLSLIFKNYQLSKFLNVFDGAICESRYKELIKVNI